MKFNRKELVQVFDAVSPGLAKREVVAQSQSFVFYDGRCYTFNDKIAVNHSMPEGWDIELAVKASEMHRALKKFAEDEVDVTVKDGTLIVATAKTRMEVKTEAEAVKHQETIGFPAEWFPLPDGFMDALRRTATCAGKSLSRPLLTFVHIKGNRMEATDNQRLVVHNLKGELPELVVPADVVPDLLGFSCNQVGLTEGWVHFKNESDVVFSTRTMDSSQYPDLAALLEVEGVAVTFPVELKNGIAKAREVLDSKDALPTVELAAKKGVLVLTAKGLYATLKERYKVEFQDELCIHIHPDMLNDAIDMAAGFIVGSNRMLVTCEESGFWHVIGLLVPEAAEAASTPTPEPEAAVTADNVAPAATEKPKRAKKAKPAPEPAPERPVTPPPPPPAPTKPVAKPAPVAAKPVPAPVPAAKVQDDDAW